MSKENEKFVVQGTLYWAHVRKPNPISDREQYTAVLALNDSDTTRLKELGANIQNKGDERGNYVTMKSTFAPRIVDAKKKEMDGKVLIGNGTKANVVIHVYEWSYAKKKGVSIGMDVIQVTELVTFEAISLLDETDGYTEDSTDEDMDTLDKAVTHTEKSPIKVTNNPF